MPNNNAALHLNTMSNGGRKEISLMVCELAAETTGLPPHSEMIGPRFWSKTGQASIRIRTSYFRADFTFFFTFRESLGAVALEVATREEGAQESWLIFKENIESWGAYYPVGKSDQEFQEQACLPKQGTSQ